jgi:hypothetical protein
LLHEGRLSVIEIASQLGHSAETLLSTYAHVIAELKDQPKAPADEQIKGARAQLASQPRDAPKTIGRLQPPTSRPCESRVSAARRK